MDSKQAKRHRQAMVAFCCGKLREWARNATEAALEGDCDSFSLAGLNGKAHGFAEVLARLRGPESLKDAWGKAHEWAEYAEGYAKAYQEILAELERLQDDGVAHLPDDQLRRQPDDMPGWGESAYGCWRCPRCSRCRWRPRGEAEGS